MIADFHGMGGKSSLQSSTKHMGLEVMLLVAPFAVLL
jgi:hypothetical protein